MPRHSVLSLADRESLITLPTRDDLIRHYTFSENDLSIIRQRRGSPNRLGFAVQLCYMRYPGILLPVDTEPALFLLEWAASQLKISPKAWTDYGQRAETRREHFLELQAIFGFQSFTADHYRSGVEDLNELAQQTDKGIVLATALIEELRNKKVLLPSAAVIDRICAEAITHAHRRIFKALTDSLTETHRQRLDDLLKRKEDSKITWLMWLRQSPHKPNSLHMAEHIKRLKIWQTLDLPVGIGLNVHQNRLLKIARQGEQMSPADLARFEVQRRYATLVALAIEGTATVTDEIIDLHDRIIGKMFATAKHKHQEKFQASGKAINDKVRLYGCIGQTLLDAREKGEDPFTSIEAVMPWDTFAATVREAQTLAQPESFDFLLHISDSYAKVRRYAPEFLNVLELKAAPAAQPILDAVEVLRLMNATNARKVPTGTSTTFVKPRWTKLVGANDAIDRHYYELCVLSELKNALRSGDMWVHGSRQFKNFDEYLVSSDKFNQMQLAHSLPVTIATDYEQYIKERLFLLAKELNTVNRLAAENSLPDAVIDTSGLKITPLDGDIPENAQALIDKVATLLPHVKITDILMEVDGWTNFTDHFTHLKTGDVAKDKLLLLTTILADGINLGLSKMAESCPGTTYARLSWLQAWHIRDETYAAALANLVNTQFKHPFSDHWGDGTTSSSDGQRFRASGKAEHTGHVNFKYGLDPGRMFYTHISDQYAPFSVKVVNVGVRDVNDGAKLYHVECGTP